MEVNDRVMEAKNRLEQLRRRMHTDDLLPGFCHLTDPATGEQVTGIRILVPLHETIPPSYAKRVTEMLGSAGLQDVLVDYLQCGPAKAL